MDVTDLERLINLIDQKGWRIFDGKLRGRHDDIQSILVKFLSRMTRPQRSLTLDLLSDYLILKDYTDPAIELLDEICKNTNSALKVAPVKVQGATRIKSGDALVYEMDAHQSVVGSREIDFYDSPYSDRFWLGEGSRILVDDFIGTGDQFVEMIDNIGSDGADPKIDLVAALVIQEEGRKKIEDLGLRVISLHTRPRALEALAKSSGNDIAQIRDIYLRMEENTECSPFISLGYMASEATVTLKKTPDNTLPIFWHEEGSGWPAPFPRKLK